MFNESIVRHYLDIQNAHTTDTTEKLKLNHIITNNAYLLGKVRFRIRITLAAPSFLYHPIQPNE